MLHELRHITGTLDGTHNGNPVGENEDIVTRCILAAQRVGGPIQVTAPPETLPTIDTPIIPTIIPPFPEEEPLPESDEPQLLVADLVIVGGDGSVLEGGEVYDPNLDPDCPATDPTGPYCWPGDCVVPDDSGDVPFDPGYGGGGGRSATPTGAGRTGTTTTASTRRRRSSPPDRPHLTCPPVPRIRSGAPLRGPATPATRRATQDWGPQGWLADGRDLILSRRYHPTPCPAGELVAIAERLTALAHRFPPGVAERYGTPPTTDVSLAAR